MKIDVDMDRCVASGQYVLLAPAVFDQDDDGTVVVLTRDVPPGDRDAVAESIRVCPSLAISAMEG